jgi:hypothetical protein
MGMRFHAEEGLVKNLICRKNTNNFALIPRTASRLMLLGLSLVVILGLFTTNASAQATDIYITPDGGGSGVCTNNTHPPSWFNNSANWGSSGTQIGPGTKVHLCGTFTGAANGNMFTLPGNGSAGRPITILFEAGAKLSSPYWSWSSGAINMINRSWITVDGGTNGVIENTADGNKLAYQAISTGIAAGPCNNCTVRNLTIANMFVHTQGSGMPFDQNQSNAIQVGGSNWTIADNTISDCGWCLREYYGNGDTNIQIYGNEIRNFDHAWAIATGGANVGTNISFHDNNVHDSANWDCGGGCHHDGIHAFGTSGSSINGFQVYNNYFYGNWGANPTGFIFIEGGTGSPAHVSNGAYWNNVAVVPPGSVVNTNGWFGIFSGDSGTTQVYNNTIIGPNDTDNTACFNIGSINNLTFKNNVSSNCGNPVQFGSFTNFNGANVDQNFYGNSCQNGHNCFVWYGSFTGSFSSWKTTCHCDANSVQNSNPLLNADGSPQVSSPVLGHGLNIMTVATGNLAALASDTSKGSLRTPSARPTTGAWDIGAYGSGSTSTTLPSPPAGLTAIVE